MSVLAEGMEFSADSLLPKRSLVIESAFINKHGRLEIAIGDQVLHYPVLWARQNCQCTKCFNPICLSYISSFKDIVYGEIQLSSVTLLEGGKMVKCVYTDDHVSEFTALWLYNRRMTEDGGKERSDCIKLCDPVPWPESSDLVVKRVTYDQVTETTAGFEIFGEALIKDGIVVITNSPDGYVYEDFAQKTGLLSAYTHYGTTWYVKNEPAPTNHAFTTVELELHTDHPFQSSYPNIQVLHCVKQAIKGGENVMSDGIRAANLLRKKHPEHYQVLTTMGFQFHDVIAHKSHQPQYYMANSAPLISLNERGVPSSIQWNNACRSGFYNGSPEQYEALITATKEFYKILYECSIVLKNKPGDMMIFDNQRILHGRKEFELTEPRELEGWYFDWDLLHSYLRVAKVKKMQQEEAN